MTANEKSHREQYERKSDCVTSKERSLLEASSGSGAVANTSDNVVGEGGARALAAQVGRLGGTLGDGVQTRLLDAVGVRVQLHVAQHHHRRQQQRRRICLVLCFLVVSCCVRRVSQTCWNLN